MKWLTWIALASIVLVALSFLVVFYQQEAATRYVATDQRSSSRSEVVITVVLVEATATNTPTPKPTMTPFPQPTPWPTWGGQMDGKLYAIPAVTMTPFSPLVHPPCVAVTPERGSVVLCKADPFPGIRGWFA